MNSIKIHIWDLPISKIYVQLDEIRKELINKSIEKAGEIIEGKARRKAYKLVKLLNKKASEYKSKEIKSSRIVFHWRRGDCFIPLWTIIEMSKLVNKPSLSFKKLEQHITYYKAKSGNYIIKAKFPLKINSEMVALYFHLFGDGCFSENKSTATYSQLDKETRDNFIQKLKNAFGDFDSSKIKGSKYSFIFPSIFAYMLKYIFNVNTFLSDKGRIPKKIKELPYLLKFSGVIAFLIDEGNVKDSISFSSNNKLFLKDFKELLLGIGFESKIRENIIFLKNKHIPQFYENYLKLISISSCCNLTFNRDSLDLLYNVNKRSRGHNFNKEEIKLYQDNIIELLKDKKLRTNELRIILFKKYKNVLSYTTLVKILKMMEKEGIVKRDRVTTRVHKWSNVS